MEIMKSLMKRQGTAGHHGAQYRQLLTRGPESTDTPFRVLLVSSVQLAGLPYINVTNGEKVLA